MRAAARLLEGIDVAAWVAEPAADAYKYRRGVVAVSAGSGRTPAPRCWRRPRRRHGNVGMVRFLDRADGTAAVVVSRYPDVVVDGSDPIRAAARGCVGLRTGLPGRPVDRCAAP